MLMISSLAHVNVLYGYGTAQEKELQEDETGGRGRKEKCRKTQTTNIAVDRSLHTQT